MAQIALLNRIDTLVIDGILEDGLSTSVQKTSYTIESGARATDHSIVGDIQRTLTGVVCGIAKASSPSKARTTSDGSIAVSSSTASANQSSSPAEALRAIIDILSSRRVFSVFTAGIQINNMMITNYNHKVTPENETNLIFQLELTEMRTVDLITGQESSIEPKSSMLSDDDPSKVQATRKLSKGQRSALTPSAEQSTEINQALGG